MTLDVVNSFGQPLKFMTIHIDGVDYRQVAVHRLVKYQGRTSFSLPRGTYRFSCDSTGATWPMERTLEILWAPGLRAPRGGAPGIVVNIGGR